LGINCVALLRPIVYGYSDLRKFKTVIITSNTADISSDVLDTDVILNYTVCCICFILKP